MFNCRPKPDWLSIGAQFFQRPRVVAVTGPYDYYDWKAWFRVLTLLTQKTGYWVMNRLIQWPGIRQGAILIGGNNLIRAATLRQVGGYDTNILFYGEDTDTAKRVATCGRVCFSNRLVMKTSARRFQTEGVMRLGFKYLAYFFKTIFAKQRPLN